ncbi:MAG: F0F1 ATP synthase subunit epsilon [Thiohalomonadales bacterium]
MAMTMHVNIVSAEEEIFSETAEVVIAPAIMGEVGIHARHTQMLTPLKPGEVRVTLVGGKEESIYVSGGILEVQPHVVTILSDTAVRGGDLDETAALEAQKAAEQALNNKSGEMDLVEAQAKLAEAMAQLQTIKRIRSKSK